jgi:uroporphyrinogen decarboxylase
MAELAHKYDLKLLLHTCGNVLQLIPRFIDLGVDILDPIQPEATGMDPVYLKREFGSSLCFRGGISAQQILAKSSRQEVVDETRRVLDILAPGGGYILSPGHPVLQDDIPVENIITMYDTAYCNQ